ncbi:hypothetical protein [Streptomyces sp. KN37]|uniref:hypothetical protein n=1 Tax=Streptomyces sp. KN37 TaxID=3090667 RepID=UPI002A7510F8|nr:hypothetical protein [Streptomyces sp. KN37]WPO69771.1 hypothetical protein R9806_03530 [Streptomyces sp. KN37]
MQSPTAPRSAPLPVWGDSSRPRLRTDALWVPHEDGAFLLCNASSLTIRGKSSYELVNRIAPHLDGTADVGQLVSGLAPAVAEQVRGLLRRLAEAGFVRDSGHDRPHGLTGRELSDYAGELAFIEYFRDSPAARYEAFRETPVLCVGSGLVLEGLVCALIQLGNRRVTTLVSGTSASTADLEAALKPALATARERDPGITVRTTRLPAVGAAGDDAAESELAGLLGANEIVLHFADAFDPDLAHRIDATSRRAGKKVLWGAVHQDHAWLGPLCEPDRGVRAPDLWARTGVAGAKRRSVFLAEPTARIVAAQLAFAAFKELTGIPADDFRERAVRVDLATLVSDEVNLRALALLPTDPAADAPATPAGWTAALPPRASESALASRELSRLVDARDGLIRDVDEGMLTQIPLHRCRATVALPAAEGGSTSDAGRLVAAEGDGPDLLSARVAAVLAAAEGAGWAALASQEAVQAADLLTGATVTVAADRLASWQDSATPIALASAVGRDEAMACALGRLAVRLLRGVALDPGPPCSADGPEVPRLLNILEAAGYRPALSTLCDLGGWAVVRADCGDGLVGVGSACDTATAGADALYDAVRALQEDVFREPLRPAPIAPVLDGSHLAAPTAPAAATAVSRAAQWLRGWLRPTTRLLALIPEPHPASRAVGRTHCAAVVMAAAPGEEPR